MTITRRAVESTGLSLLRSVVGTDGEFYRRPGAEHYRLLAYLSTLFNERTILDIGTHHGSSALALSCNPANQVHSFDIVDEVPDSRRLRPNVEYHLGDLFDSSSREQWRDLLLQSALIFIDVDPHDGKREYELVRWFQDNQYAGIIVLDDIWYFREMRNELWHKLDGQYKTDLTRVGHWSGTGAVSFHERVEFEPVDLSNWTLVTGYFDLTAMPDASTPIRDRPASYYFDHATATLSREQNLVLFCEPAHRDALLSMRPRHLLDRTRVITMSFEDFPLARYRDQIVANRGGGSCRRDPRNTVSYYLFCMARYAMLKRVISDNPFASSHFAWINLCIERMGFKNLVYLDDALGQQRDRFSTCYIDYVPSVVVSDLPTYYGPQGCRNCHNRCSMCSGFFTGNAHYMRAVCDAVEAEFVRCAEAGFGHADEQLYSIVYFKHPELFDWYLGDYSEMITNYARVHDRPEAPLANLIRHSLEAEDWGVCARACDILLDSYASGACSLTETQLGYLGSVKRVCDDRLWR